MLPPWLRLNSKAQSLLKRYFLEFLVPFSFSVPLFMKPFQDGKRLLGVGMPPLLPFRLRLCCKTKFILKHWFGICGNLSHFCTSASETFPKRQTIFDFPEEGNGSSTPTPAMTATKLNPF